MKSRPGAINNYLWAAAFLLVAGCGTAHLSGKKEYTFIQVYLEARNGASTGAQMVKVLNAPVYVEPEPFLTEADMTKARLVDEPDGTWAVQVMFTDHGSLLLDMTSTSSKGLKLVIFTAFPKPGWKDSKRQDAFSTEKTTVGQERTFSWSAAPITRNLTGGVLQFTPEGSHAEAERIVRGLNNMGKELEKQR